MRIALVVIGALVSTSVLAQEHERPFADRTERQIAALMATFCPPSVPRCKSDLPAALVEEAERRGLVYIRGEIRNSRCRYAGKLADEPIFRCD